jgi:hypothetical protein
MREGETHEVDTTGSPGRRTAERSVPSRSHGSRPRRFSGPLRLTIAAAAVFVLAIVAALMLQVTAPTGQTVPFRGAGLVLEYPANWQAVRPSAHPADREWLVLLTNQQQLGDPCPSDGGTADCSRLAYALEPGSVVVTVIVFYDSPPQDVLRGQAIRGAQPATVAGTQGWTGVVDPYPGSGADQAVVWIIPMPASTGAAYEIRADLRGPDTSRNLEQVRQIVASVQF